MIAGIGFRSTVTITSFNELLKVILKGIVLLQLLPQRKKQRMQSF